MTRIVVIMSGEKIIYLTRILLKPAEDETLRHSGGGEQITCSDAELREHHESVHVSP